MYVGVNEQAYVCNYTPFVPCVKLPVVAFLPVVWIYHSTLYCFPTGSTELHTYYSTVIVLSQCKQPVCITPVVSVTGI